MFFPRKIIRFADLLWWVKKKFHLVHEKKVHGGKTLQNTLTCQIIMQQILLFLGEKNTYTTLLGPTRLLFQRFFLQNLIFTCINEKKPQLQV